MRNDVVACWSLKRTAEELNLSIAMVRLLADRGALPSFRDSAMRRMFLPMDVQRSRSSGRRRRRASRS